MLNLPSISFSFLALLAGCATGLSAPAPPRPDQGSSALFLTFRATADQPSDAIPEFRAPCPLKIEHPADGAQLLLRRAIERDSIVQSGVTTIRYPRALGDYQAVMPGVLGLGDKDWLRLDCQSLRSVAVVPRGA